MEKLMLSADGDIMLYEVDKQILNDFDNLIKQFFKWKKTNCYDEQLFVKFLQQKYGNNVIKISYCPLLAFGLVVISPSSVSEAII